MVKECKTDEEKIHKVMNYVANNIKYQTKSLRLNADYLWDSLILDANAILKKRAGDCMQKSVLFISMLTALGFRTKFAMWILMVKNHI
jgi:transglutaminase-like putative cysteine protease